MSEFDRIWCCEYDEDSYHHSLQVINFQKYLSNILSNRYFIAFQDQAYMELNNSSQWNQRCWLVLQFFQYLNTAFDPLVFEKKLQFVPVRKLRRVYGCFRMWIDLERLYLLMFLKLDRIQFQEDRIFFALYRALKFFYELLTEYYENEFEHSYLEEISKNVRKHCQLLSNALPTYFNSILSTLSKMFAKYTKKQSITEFATDLDELKKFAYQKLIKLFDMTPQVEERLKQNVGFQDRYREMQQISRFVENPDIQEKAESIKNIYDPKMRIIMDYKQKCKADKVPFDQAKLDQLLQQYEQREKDKKTTQNNYYQNIMRSGHNPYEQSNYAIYGETLKVDMNDKLNLEIEPIKEEEDSQPVEEKNYIYDPQFIERAEKLTTSSAQVTNKDLVTNVMESQKKKAKRNGAEEKGNISGMKWKLYKDEEEKQKMESNNNFLALTTMQSLNRQKNLDNNALFFNEKEKDELEDKIMAIKIMSREGIKSEVLFGMQKKAQKVYQKDKMKFLFNLNKNCTIDRHTFDGLRKVLQLASTEKKIDKWIYEEQLPDLYPRTIDQIRQWPTNPLIMQEKKRMAFEEIQIND